jgi:hypothetical protein
MVGMLVASASKAVEKVLVKVEVKIRGTVKWAEVWSWSEVRNELIGNFFRDVSWCLYSPRRTITALSDLVHAWCLGMSQGNLDLR